MSDGESQRQLLLMIRDFAVEKTHGDRRVSDLKKRLLELQDEHEAANADFEKAKLAKEFAERELRESQAQLGRTSASLLAMEARISGLQNDMSHASSELHALKNVAEIHRDEFMRAMLEFNCDIRKFHEETYHALKMGHPHSPSHKESDMQDINMGKNMQNENGLKDMEDELSSMNNEERRFEGDYQKALQHADGVHHDHFASLKKKVAVMESVILKSDQLKDLSGQNSELEKTYSSLAEELRRRFTCPKCQLNNMEALESASGAEGTPS